MNVCAPFPLRVLPLLLLLAACGGPREAAPAAATATPAGSDQHVPDFARRPFEPFARANVVGIALREWRGFGSVVNEASPDNGPPLPYDLRPDRQPGLWQRVGEYWWLSQAAGSREGGWTGKYDEFGQAYQGDPAAWSAAFISYVMRSAGAGERFAYSPLHADYINAAAREQGVVRIERPSAYAPQTGDLICVGRGASSAIRFEVLPTSRFTAHCDLIVAAQAGELTVVGGNVHAGITMRHVPLSAAGALAEPDGTVIDPRHNWFVVLRVLYES